MIVHLYSNTESWTFSSSLGVLHTLTGWENQMFIGVRRAAATELHHIHQQGKKDNCSLDIFIHGEAVNKMLRSSNQFISQFCWPAGCTGPSHQSRKTEACCCIYINIKISSVCQIIKGRKCIHIHLITSQVAKNSSGEKDDECEGSIDQFEWCFSVPRHPLESFPNLRARLSFPSLILIAQSYC